MRFLKQVSLIAPQQFQVFQAGSSGQQVVGDVQYVVGIVAGQMDLSKPRWPSMAWSKPSFLASRWIAPIRPLAVARSTSRPGELALPPVGNLTIKAMAIAFPIPCVTMDVRRMTM